MIYRAFRTHKKEILINKSNSDKITQNYFRKFFVYENILKIQLDLIQKSDLTDHARNEIFYLS